jgi:hypothetical protein
MKQDLENEILEKQERARLAREARVAEEARRKAAELKELEDARVQAEQEAERRRLEKQREEAERLARKPVLKISVVETTWFKRNYRAEEAEVTLISFVCQCIVDGSIYWVFSCFPQAFQISQSM